MRAIYSRARRGRPTAWEVEQNHAYDRMTAQLIKSVMARDSWSIDAGANQGLFLKQLIAAAPDGQQHAFEPIPVLAARLRTLYPAATIHELALSNRPGNTTFRYLPETPAVSSLFVRPDREKDHEVVELTVRVERLDDVYPGDAPLHFMKVDVEGAELDLFEGAIATLTRCQPVVVFETRDIKLPAIADLLSPVGLQVHLLPDLLAGRERPREEVERLAVEQGQWYFAAAPAGLTQRNP